MVHSWDNMVGGDIKWCSVCAGSGKKVELKALQINFEEAIYLCPEKECTYPLGAIRVQTNVIRRSAKDLWKRKKFKPLKEKRSSAKLKSNVKLLSQLPTCLLSPTPQPSTISTESKPVLVCNSKSFEPYVKETPQVAPVKCAFSACSEGNVPLKDIKDDRNNTEKATVGSKLSFVNKFLMWKNSDALCWLDVSMCLIVHSVTLKKTLDHLKTVALGKITSLLLTYNKAQQKFQRSLQSKLDKTCDSEIAKTVGLETSVGPVAVKTGGGDPLDYLASFDDLQSLGLTQTIENTHPAPLDDVLGVQTVLPQKNLKTGSGDQAKNIEREAKQTLSMLREDVWNFLQPKLKCQKGKNDSPVFALPLLLPGTAATKYLWWMKYSWQMTCTQCGHFHTDRVEKSIVTFPTVPEYFSMDSPCFLRKCFKCNEEGQKMMMKYDSLPDMIWVHFVEGLHSPTFSDYDFSHNNQNYAVTGIVQYVTSPYHFVAWLRNPIANTWLHYNDLESDVCQYTSSPPTFHPSQVHIMLWEKQPEDSGYTRPIKSELFAQMYSKSLVPKSAPEPPPIQRYVMPGEKKAQSATVSAKLSHLRPVEPKISSGTSPFTLPPSKPFRPLFAPSVDGLLGDGKDQPEDRIQRMRARFQTERGIVSASGSNTCFQTATTQSRNLPISSASYATMATKVTIASSPNSAGWHPPNTTTTMSTKMLKKNSVLPKTTGSYLAAIQPFLKKSAPALAKYSSQSNTFEGYVPKSKQLLDAKPTEQLSSVGVKTLNKCVKKNTSSKKLTKGVLQALVNKSSKTGLAKTVSFCDSDGFKVPAYPLAKKQTSPKNSRQGVKRKISDIETTTNKVAKVQLGVLNETSSRVLCHNVSGMGKMQVLRGSTASVTSTGNNCQKAVENCGYKSPPGVEPSATTNIPSMSHQILAQHQFTTQLNVQEQPLDLSPTRKDTRQSPKSSGFNSIIDQLCSNLPSDLSAVPNKSMNSEPQSDPYSLQNLFGSDEQDVLKSLTDALVPDNYPSPTKALPTSPISKSYGELNFSSLLSDL